VAEKLGAAWGKDNARHDDGDTLQRIHARILTSHRPESPCCRGASIKLAIGAMEMKMHALEKCHALVRRARCVSALPFRTKATERVPRITRWKEKKTKHLWRHSAAGETPTPTPRLRAI